MCVDGSLANRRMTWRSVSPCVVRGFAPAATAVASFAASVLLACPATADSGDSLRAAVISARTAYCEPLRSDPVVERVAEIVNRSTDVWLDHKGRAVPIPDPLPALKDLGYRGGKAMQISGAGDTDAKAIEGLLISGYDKLPDCSYTDYGVNVMQNLGTGHYLAAVVLAGD